MSRQIQIRRGTATQNNNFTGAIGEVTMDTTNNTLRVHDGTTVGGNEIMSKKQFYSNVTNCLTEIPQDIKLELNSGTLTLKAGSKCYLKTDTTTPSVNVASDLTTTQTTDGTYFAIYNGSALTTVLTSTYDYSSLPNTYSLPLALISVSGGAISSIRQIFNGFGYIGSTVFVLPDVKALIPNGRNADGTLKNTEVSVSTVKTSTLQYDSEQIWSFTDSTGSISGDTINPGQSVYFIKNLKNMYGLGITSGYNKCYVEETNLWYQNANASTWTVINMCLFAHTRSSSLKITSFNSKTDFHAIDYNDTNFIAHQALPSGTSIDLTLGISGLSYKAPEDGWIWVTGSSTANNVYNFVRLVSGGLGSTCWNSSSGNTIEVSLPVSKGQTFYVYYNQFSVAAFKFYYANGAA